MNRPGVLIINRSDSKCGGCGESTMPYDKSHTAIYGYGPKNGTAGCGMVYTHLDSDYIGMADVVRKMRPDLIPIGQAVDDD